MSNAIFTFDREAIFKALFSLVGSAYQWTSPAARKVKLWGDVAVTDRPTLFQYEGGNETYRWNNNSAVPVVSLEATLFVYTDAKDATVIGATQINKIMNGIHDKMMPIGKDAFGGGSGRQTLGGLVHWARIEGEVRRTPGDLDGDGIIRVPIMINVNK